MMRIIAKTILMMVLLGSSVSSFSQVEGCSEYEEKYEKNKDNPIIGSEVREELRACYLDKIEKAIRENQCDVAQGYFEKYHAVLDEYGDTQTKRHIWECMNCIGSVVTRKGETIFLMQQERDGIRVLKSYAMKENQLEETIAFNITGKLRSTIYSVKYDCWNTSNPDGGFFIFNPTDNLLYIPLMEETSWGKVCGSDRYIVYEFNGEQFALHNRNDGGFWINSSLRSFKSFVAILRTPNHMIRIDETAQGFRYAAWNGDARMTDDPALVMDGDMLETQRFEFDNGSYGYSIDLISYKLIITKNDHILREEPIEIVLYRDSNCW